MSEPQLDPNDIRRLLGAVAADPSLQHPDRSALRGAVLNEYRSSARRVGDPGVGDESAEAAGSPLLELVSTDDAGTGHRERRREVVLAVAAATLVVIAGVSWFRSRPDGLVETTATTTVSPVDRSVCPDSDCFDGIAGGIALDVPDGVVVEHLPPASLELRPLENPWGSSLLLFEADESLADAVDRAVEDGSISAVQRVARWGDGLAPEYEIRPQNDQLDCVAATCLTLGGVALDVDGVNIAREFRSPDGRVIWSFFRSENVNAPFVSDANEILESLEFVSDR